MHAANAVRDQAHIQAVIGPASTRQQRAFLLCLKFSWGKWNSDDVRSLEEPTVMLITHVGCLLNFDPLAGTSRTEPPAANASASTASLVDTNTHETYLLRQLHMCNELSEGPRQSSANERTAAVDKIRAYGISVDWDCGGNHFTFKYLFISIALRLPTIFRSTAHFYYVEKGIWFLRHMSLSLVWVAWYVGNGTSNGNPYGTAAAFGVVVSQLIFLRVFAPERYLAGNIMCCATFALVYIMHYMTMHIATN
ncbi:hypothetical protein DFH09DRAFT_1314828 [Mycena vulgaris]|nr:hypothetical protein DFH09DRAFT_1314828 [Mycena vulgaris]